MLSPIPILIVAFLLSKTTAIHHMKSEILMEAIDQFPSTQGEPLTGYEFDMSDILGLGPGHRERLKRHMSLKNSASKFLLEVYNDITENEEELDHVREHLTRGRQRRALRDERFITKFDRMEIEKCNNIITFSSKSKFLSLKIY